MGDYGLKAKPGRDIVIVIIVFAIISVISVILRIYSRRILNISLAFDDYLIVVAMVRPYTLPCEFSQLTSLRYLSLQMQS